MTSVQQFDQLCQRHTEIPVVIAPGEQRPRSTWVLLTNRLRLVLFSPGLAGWTLALNGREWSAVGKLRSTNSVRGFWRSTGRT